jgi:hypothetical protein
MSGGSGPRACCRCSPDHPLLVWGLAEDRRSFPWSGVLVGGVVGAVRLSPGSSTCWRVAAASSWDGRCRACTSTPVGSRSPFGFSACRWRGSRPCQRTACSPPRHAPCSSFPVPASFSCRRPSQLHPPGTGVERSLRCDVGCPAEGAGAGPALARGPTLGCRAGISRICSLIAGRRVSSALRRGHQGCDRWPLTTKGDFAGATRLRPM